MTPQVLLEQLRELLATVPPLEGRGSYGREQHVWLGRANAALHSWDEIKSIPFKAAVNGLLRNTDRPANFGVVMMSLYDVIARIESDLPQPQGQAFGPGAAYDFFQSLNDLVGTAERDLLVVDPYMDAEVFDGYLHSVRQGTAVRLLVSKYLDNVRVAAEKHRVQYGSTVEVRSSRELHDRIVLVDQTQCWVLGASVKDAAAKKPTYLAPLSPEVAAQKRDAYEEIWQRGTPI